MANAWKGASRLAIGSAIVIALLMAAMPALGADNGETRQASNGPPEAFSAARGEWLPLEQFWQEHAEASGGLTWGRGESYPPYNEVKEYDLFLVELPQGPCLMEFFHQRWRRANDVRRWDDAMNDLAGCPHVFD